MEKSIFSIKELCQGPRPAEGQLCVTTKGGEAGIPQRVGWGGWQEGCPHPQGWLRETSEGPRLGTPARGSSLPIQ